MSSITVKNTPKKPWPDFPIPSAWVQKGRPEGKGMVLIENNEEGTCIGMWECSPGTYEWDYDSEEYVYLLKGEVIITEIGGPSYTLKKGDNAHFPKGIKTIWHIKKSLRKIFFIRK